MDISFAHHVFVFYLFLYGFLLFLHYLTLNFVIFVFWPLLLYFHLKRIRIIYLILQASLTTFLVLAIILGSISYHLFDLLLSCTSDLRFQFGRFSNLINMFHYLRNKQSMRKKSYQHITNYWNCLLKTSYISK